MAVDWGFMYAWVLIPLGIFFARILDVSLGTLRIIFVSKGIIKLAPIIGFFEVLIWLMAIGQIMQNLTTLSYYFFYAAGFAAGTYAGIVFEQRLSIGNVIVRVILQRDSTVLEKYLKRKKYGLTVVEGEGVGEKVRLIFMIVDRHDVGALIKIIKHFNPYAMYTIEDIRDVHQAMFPPRKTNHRSRRIRQMMPGRKGK